MKIKVLTTFLVIMFIFLNFNLKSNANTHKDYNITFDLENNKITTDTESLTMEKLQPGSKGNINFKIIHLKNYIGKYRITFAGIKNKPTNMYFIYNGKTYWDLNTLNGLIEEDIYVKDFVTLTYVWDYETGDSSDEIDVNDGIDALEQGFDFSFSSTLCLDDNNFEVKSNNSKSNSIKSDKEKQKNPIVTISKLPKTGK